MLHKKHLGILLIAALCLTEATLASETRTTKNVQAKWFETSLSKHLTSIKLVQGIVQVESDGTYTRGEKRLTSFSLEPGQCFDGPPDHHASSQIKLVAVGKKSIKLTYQARFDHRSFGKDLITEDSGEINLPLSSSNAASQ